MLNQIDVSRYYEGSPPMATPLNKYLAHLYRIRRSAWGLALLLNHTSIGFSEAYNLEHSALCTDYSKAGMEASWTLMVRRKNSHSSGFYALSIVLNNFAYLGAREWFKSFEKPKAHVISAAMTLAAQRAEVLTVGGKVKGAPGCILNATYDTEMKREELRKAATLMDWTRDNGR